MPNHSECDREPDDSYPVSPCCQAPIEQGSKREYPLGIQFYETFKIDICQECGQEVEEPLEACGVCGELMEVEHA